MADTIPSTPGAPIASNSPQAIVDNRADQYTVFTEAGGTKQLVSVPQWTKLTLRLETAGPVAVSTRAQIDPISSGKGRMLPQNTDVIIILGPNTRFYYASTGFHRVSVQVEAFPWDQSIFEALRSIQQAILGLGAAGSPIKGTLGVPLRRGC